MSMPAAQLVRRMRLLRQLTKSDFADLVGVAPSTIGRIESGEMDPTYGSLQKIAAGAGYRLDGSLTDLGDDEPFAQALDRIVAAEGEERAKLIMRLGRVAPLAPVTKRPGVRFFSMDGSMEAFLDKLQKQGQRPIVSSLEAVAGDLSERRSFIPVVYVERPEDLRGLPTRSPSAPVNVAVLPVTRNVRRFTRERAGFDMVAPAWGMLDALASPGRQPDAAMAYLGRFAGIDP